MDSYFDQGTGNTDTKITGINTAITDLESDITTKLVSPITNLDNSFALLKGNIIGVKNDFNSIETDVQILTNNNTGNPTPLDLTDLGQKIDEVDLSVTGLTNNVNEMSGKLGIVQ